VKQIAEESDLVIVVGSRNSSNSVRLVEVALDAGADAAYLVDDASAIDPAWLDGVATVGVTSGASVPDDLVSGVLDRLAASGFDTVSEVEVYLSGWCSRCRTSSGARSGSTASPPGHPGHLAARLSPGSAPALAGRRGVARWWAWGAGPRHRAVLPGVRGRTAAARGTWR